jgi:hypothetical protein
VWRAHRKQFFPIFFLFFFQSAPAEAMSLRVAASFVLLLLLGVSLVHVHAQASFAVDCFPSGVTKGKVVIPPTIALDNSMTVQIDINPRPGWGTSWLFHTSTGAQAVGLQLVKVSGATATLNFRVGSVTASSQVFALPASKFTSLAIRVRPTTPNTIDFIVDGRVVSTSSPANLGVLSQSREITLCHSLQFNGLIDNFAIWAEHKDANFVNSFTKTIPLAVRIFNFCGPSRSRELFLWRQCGISA